MGDRVQEGAGSNYGLGVKNRLERFAWDERVAQVAAESVGCDVRKGVELDPVGQL